MDCTSLAMIVRPWVLSTTGKISFEEFGKWKIPVFGGLQGALSLVNPISRVSLEELTCTGVQRGALHEFFKRCTARLPSKHQPGNLQAGRIVLL
jgi:hypothetical protein